MKKGEFPFPWVGVVQAQHPDLEGIFILWENLQSPRQLSYPEILQLLQPIPTKPTLPSSTLLKLN